MFDIIVSLLILLLNSQAGIPADVKDKLSQNLADKQEKIYTVPDIPTPFEALSKILSPTPTGSEELNEPADHYKSATIYPTIFVKNEDNKESAYNNRSDKPIGDVAEKAVEKSPALEPCSDHPELCQTNPASVSPQPTIYLSPPPITQIPVPTEFPLPSICPQKMECPMIMCLEVHGEYTPEGRCGCSCNPMIL